MTNLPDYLLASKGLKTFFGDCTPMARKFQLICSATWKYLNQRLSNSEPDSVWEIERFWYLYQVQLLENCLKKEVGTESHYTQ